MNGHWITCWTSYYHVCAGIRIFDTRSANSCEKLYLLMLKRKTMIVLCNGKRVTVKLESRRYGQLQSQKDQRDKQHF